MKIDNQSGDDERNIGTCVVVEKDGKILLGKRLSGYKSGYYGLPAGRLKKNESILDSANRELFEETNIKAKN